MKQTIKKHKAKPVEKDFSALDSAVEELARHNAMLQSEIDGHPAHPQLPKRKVVKPLKAGRSFDIVHTSSRTKKPVRKKITATNQEPANNTPEDEEMLARDATSEAQTKKQPEKKAAVSAATQPIILDEPDEVAEPTVEQIPNNPESMSEPEAAKDVKDDLSEAPLSEVVEQSEESLNQSEVDPPKTNELKGSGQVYANNLVQSSNPAGYKPHKTQPTLAVFDAENYHGELHDWSRLGDRRGRQWLFLSVLLTILLLLLAITIFRPSFLPAWLHIPIF